MQKTMKGAVLPGNRTVEIKGYPVPVPGHGEVPIPFSLKKRNMLSNLRSVVEDPLSDAEMAEIAGIDRNCRLIKGQAFLWKDGQTWEDLWDVDGTVTEP